MYTDCDTPSGDASILKEHQDLSRQCSTIVFNSTAVDGSDNRPEPNISVIGQSGISVNDSAPNHVTCDLCGTILKGQGYLAQHRGKKKCLDKQRTNRDSQLQMEASMARVRSMHLSESDCAEGDIGAVDLSKVYKSSFYFPILT